MKLFSSFFLVLVLPMVSTVFADCGGISRRDFVGSCKDRGNSGHYCRSAWRFYKAIKNEEGGCRRRSLRGTGHGEEDYASINQMIVDEVNAFLDELEDSNAVHDGN